MKDNLLILILVLFAFGLGNFLFTFIYFSLCCDSNPVLLVPFAGKWSGNVPQPVWQLFLSNDILEGIGQRLGTSSTWTGFNDGWPFSIWEMSWSISLYLSMVMLPVWYIKSRKNKMENY